MSDVFYLLTIGVEDHYSRKNAQCTYTVGLYIHNMPEIGPNLKMSILWVTFTLIELILTAYQGKVKAQVFPIT